jgi:hypothetical protein
LTEVPPPDFEARAASIYLRGEPMRISGREGSVNIDFSGAIGGELLRQRLEAARKRSRKFLEIRIPRQCKNLIEFIPDLDLESLETAELSALAEAGLRMAAEVWPEDDFSDWEQDEAKSDAG